jgi:catechol 2,3-dioxygenase-like lactoylglutathione lyase family enzyme
MTQLNHTIVASRDPQLSADFFAEILGRPAPQRFGPFLVVELDNGVSLDFLAKEGEIASQHYAFLITEEEFDEVLGRLRAKRMPHWADPYRTRRNEINRYDGGRGLYFEHPDGHWLEVITRPYGRETEEMSV